MKIAISDGIDYALNANYRTIDLESTDFTNIAAIVVTMADLPRIYAEIDSLGFPIPIFVGRYRMAMSCLMSGYSMCMGCLSWPMTKNTIMANW